MRRPLVFAAAVITAVSTLAPARAAGSVVAFRCHGGGGIAAMENAYMTAVGAGPCWAHLGHHTYDLGGPHAVGAVAGSVFSVEIQLSPPVEYAVFNVAAAVIVEASADGRSWQTLHEIPYELVLRDPHLLPARQSLSFSFDAGGIVARYLRIRQPRSSARGLSGFLDSSGFDAVLEAVAAAEPAAPGTRSLSCDADILEDVFAEHPCWFGGLNRYDGASFFHTYPLGSAHALTRIAGSATLLPWRSDDYTQGGGSRTATHLIVQVSSDGVTWTDVATAAGTYGAPIAFAVEDLGGLVARHVRLVPERHARFHLERAFAPNKHPRGYFIDSRIDVTSL